MRGLAERTGGKDLYGSVKKKKKRGRWVSFGPSRKTMPMGNRSRVRGEADKN